MTHNRALVPEDRPNRPAKSLERAAFAHAKAAALDNTTAPEVIARERWRDDVAAVLTRGASAPALTTDPAWAGALARNAVSDYVVSLEPLSAGAKLLNLAPRVSLNGVATISFPRQDGATAARAHWIAEFSPIPVPQFSLESAVLGPVKKLAAIAVATRETVESGAGETVITTLLREACAKALDEKLFSDNAASSSAPAGLLDGVAGLTATTGDDAALADLSQIAANIATSGPIVYVAHPAQASYLMLRRGFGVSADTVVLPTLGVAEGTVIGLDPAALVSAFGPEPEMDSTRETVIHMEDTTPLAIGTAGTPATVAAPTLSAFQTDCIATKLILRAAWTWRAAGAVAWVSGASWGSAP